MQTFTAFEYLLIDAASQYGVGSTYEKRIEWAKENINNLMDLVPDVKQKNQALYIKSVQAINDVRQGKPTGHRVSFDASCSGAQIMSALMNCHAGALATGLINPDQPEDAYEIVYDAMRLMLNQEDVVYERDDVKQAVMTSLYGSSMEPKKLFGEGDELLAFYKAMEDKLKGAYYLLQYLLRLWDDQALFNAWRLPDNHLAYIPIMDKVETKVEVDELDHHSFIYEYRTNKPLEFSVSLAANVVHSIDAYVLRTLVRRCNYNKENLTNTLNLIIAVRLGDDNDFDFDGYNTDNSIQCYELYKESGLVDTTHLHDISYEEWLILLNSDSEYVNRVQELITTILKEEPFPIITVHDDFSCHANNMNTLRYHYKEILADIADSTLIDHVIGQIIGDDAIVERVGTGLGDLIRSNANYPIN